MSLRREQAELQRALELSTQQAATFAHIPPYTLSSATTVDSRDLELRPAAPLAAPVQSSNSMASTSVSHSGPTTPLRRGPSYPVSPDSPRRRLPRQSMVEVVVPRMRRESSRDPLDFLDTPDCIVTGEGPPPPVPLPPSSIEVLPASGNSAASADGRRLSARVQKKHDDEEAAAAERKRKRAEKRAQAAAEKAELQRRIDAGEIEAPQEVKKKRQRVTEPRPKTTKTTKTDASQSSHRPSSQSEPGERLAPVPPSSESNPTATATVTSTGSSSSRVSTPIPAYVTAEPVSSERPGASSPTKALGTPQTAPLPSSSPAQPTTPSLPPTSSNPAPTTPAARPLQPSKSTPTSSDRPSTPGPNGYRWKTARNDLASVLNKFPKARPTGMSRRLKIQSLHTTIGPGKAAPPPPPPKRKPKEESDDDDDDPDKIRVGSREWLMMED